MAYQKWEGDLDKTAVIYYQGKDASGIQAVKYLGGEPLVATTGEVAEFKYKGITTIPDEALWLYPEIKEINRAPSFGVLSRLKNWWRGISVSSTQAAKKPLYETDQDGSVYNYSVTNKERSLGQETDITAHQEKYQSLRASQPDRNKIIAYGVSRGAATTYAAVANNNYNDIALCVLEAPPGSVRNLVKTKLPFGIGGWLYNTRVAQWILGAQHSSEKSAQAQAYVDKFPSNVPLVVISSQEDTVVPHGNSLKLAQMVAAKRVQEFINQGKSSAPVYFIQLDKPDHNDYSLSDKYPDAERYQNILHAIYKKHNLPHIPDLAALGEEEMPDTILTQGFLAQQMVLQDKYKQHRQERTPIEKEGLKHLKTSDVAERQKAICRKLPMYKTHKFFKSTAPNEETYKGFTVHKL